ncbi:MAG TPA: beta-ketoacyl-ACP synthase III [Acidimicrobiia bacterium]|nr:beta-ketoacyl-ACP synthase III [Acidimicrobiia bacterium]
MRRSRISGLGIHVPDRVVTNDELGTFMDTSDEWIIQRTGIRERRWADPETATSDLGVAAARAALSDAGVEASDVDMIVFATLSPDHYFPGAACFLQAKMGMGGIPAIDVRQQCTGFVYALSLADAYVRIGMASRVLVVGAEIHSAGLDVTTRGRDVAVLFGDGAGAAVVEATDVADPATDPHIWSSHLHADGTGAEELWLPAPGMAYERFMTKDQIDAGLQYPVMNGRTVFVNAVKRMSEAVVEAAAANDIEVADVDLFLFHQANLRINQSVAGHLGIDDTKVFNTIERYGNTTAATIPIGMFEARAAGALEPGMVVMLAAFGSGFTWGATLLRF